MTSRSRREINSQSHTPLQNKGERKKSAAWFTSRHDQSGGANRNRVDITANGTPQSTEYTPNSC